MVRLSPTPHRLPRVPRAPLWARGGRVWQSAHPHHTTCMRTGALVANAGGVYTDGVGAFDKVRPYI